jgi:hypothetical protein
MGTAFWLHLCREMRQFVLLSVFNIQANISFKKVHDCYADWQINNESRISGSHSGMKIIII